MKRTHWFILLGIALALLACCWVAVCGLAGLYWWGEATIQASPASLYAARDATPALSLTRREPTSAEQATVQLLERSVIPERDLVALAQRLQGLDAPLTLEERDSPPDYELGDRRDFWVHDVQTISFFTVTAELRWETPHAYWWIQEGYDIPGRDLKGAAERFETQTYPTSRRYFGSEWTPGVDGDPRIYIFLGDVPGVGGYFSAPDEYPSEVRPYSNEHEMFYINLENAAPGSDYFDGILAHEFQHMIHWAIDRNEDTWVNEGLSELAAQISGYDVGGSDYMFSTNPDTQLTAWAELEDSAPHYGASYLFLAYFLEQYGEEAIRQLVSEPSNGAGGFESVMAETSPAERQFEDLFADWVVANYLDSIGSRDERHEYSHLRIPQPSHANRHSSYPVRRQATVHQYAADYILLEGEGDLTISFTGSRVVPLVGNKVRGGVYQWWSNRGDDGDATLTRAFDLSSLAEATLQAWMWYDLEADWDYAYVEVSTDEGKTWTLLENEHTTTTNPSGNSYGPALTGQSGDEDEPGWVQETFDLTPYAGQKVLVRFEVITDEALNRPGLCLDEIAIPELGYRYDPEDGEGGWQAEGWVRVTDHVPQEFLVQLVTLGRQTYVRRLALNDQMQGKITIAGLGQHKDRAVLVVSALAPVTTEWAAYAYEITQE